MYEDLHGPPGDHGELGDAELEIEGLRLAAERASHGGLHHADPGHVHVQDPGQLPVQIVGDLGGRPHRQFPAPLVLADGTVGLNGCVGRALEEVLALHDHVRGVHELVHGSELQLYSLGDVAVPPLLLRLVDEGAVGRLQGLARIEVRSELLVLYTDRLEGTDRRVLVHSGHRRHPVSDVAYPLDAEGRLVWSPRDDAVLHRHLPAGDHRVDSLHGQRLAGVDGEDAGVGMWAPEDLPVEHARKDQVVSEVRLPRGLLRAVDLPES